MRWLLCTLAIALLAAGLGGCTGRGGSQGFDITENAAIDQALEQNECVDYDDLTICPAGQSSSDTPTPGGAPSIATDVADATAIDCYQPVAGGACTTVLRFTPHNFPAQTAFAVFSRADAESNPWILANDPVPVSGTSSFEATVLLTAPQGAPADVQLSILAFPTDASSSTSVQDLSQTAASFAFVTDVLTVNLVVPTPTTTPTRRASGTPTPTRTPGANDCCQCPASCAAPIAGACPNDCDVMYGTVCFGEELCVLHTPTPTPSPSPSATPCLGDNGDGTISDRCTGLMWEKKDLTTGVHDVGAAYPWAGRCSGPSRALCQPDAAAAATCAQQTNGASGCAECPSNETCRLDSSNPLHPTVRTIWGWLNQMNEDGFAGYSDWRIPAVGEDGGVPELETILLPACTLGQPCVPDVFDTNCDDFAGATVCGPLSSPPCPSGQACVPRADIFETCRPDPPCTGTTCSCTWTRYYWSSTSTPPAPPEVPPGAAWQVEFAGATLHRGSKESSLPVRAVRGMFVPSPTPTPGANDCCACESSCSAPVAGTCDGCTIIRGAACDSGPGCSPHTPTPTPTACLQDNGDGTITDGCTNLIWEKKDQSGGLHDKDTTYTWAGACMGNTALCQPNAAAAAACTAQTSGAVGCAECATGTCVVDPSNQGATTTIWDWLSELNATGLAGYNDWQIPTVGYEGDAPQLETIDGVKTPPCSVPPEFDRNCTAGCLATACSCTGIEYWAATTYLAAPGNAEVQGLGVCHEGPGVSPKTNSFGVRAVRRNQ